jgi:membrane-associated protein
LNPFFLDALQQYGYPALWLIVFVAAIGAPISGNLLLFAAGAFAAFGDFKLIILFPVAVSAAVLGDNVTYFVGRRVGVPLLTWFQRQRRFRWISPQALERGLAYFRRRSGWTIFITRFLIVALGGAINLLAGVEQYPYRNFLFWDVSGQILGAGIPLGLGFIFAESWEEVAGIFGAFSGLFLAFAAALVLTMLILRRIRQSKAARATAAEEPEEPHPSEPVEQEPEPSQTPVSAAEPGETPQPAESVTQEEALQLLETRQHRITRTLPLSDQ